MSNGSSNGGAPRDPFGGAGSGRAEDGYPTQAIPQQRNPAQGPPQQGRPGAPSGSSQQGYPHQAPRSYPQPGQFGPPQGYGQPPQGGQYGPPPQGGPYGQGQPPQGGQYRQGQPPQGYGPQNLHGYDRGQSVYASQPNKSKTGMMVAIIGVIVALILATVAWFVMDTKAERVTPPPTSEPTAVQTSDVEPTPTEPTDDVTTAPEDPAPNGAVPLMPEGVGDYTAQGGAAAELTVYMNEDLVTVVAIHGKTGTIPGLVAGLNAPQVIGVWTCGVDPDSALDICLGDVQGGVLSLGGNLDANSIAAFGDEFVKLWK
ncbi:hypothetical protein [Tessaracoccus sp.]